MRVYENQFHPLGGVAAEVFAFGADWILRARDSEFDQPGRDQLHFMCDDGTATETSAYPQWWLDETPATLSAVRGRVADSGIHAPGTDGEPILGA
jgi:hypothetical protein